LEINAIAARGFQAGAGAYDRARPDYPAGAVDWLCDRLRIRAGAHVLDVGAGTGKLTALLVPSGARLVAIEPVDTMRSRLSAAVPSARVIAGTAEEIPLATGSIDAAVAAQAFHWFDGPRALAEFHRVLRPGGRLGLVWNVRDRSRPWTAAVHSIVDEVCDATWRHEMQTWRAAFSATTLFGPLEEAEFSYAQELGEAGMIDRIASTSFIALLDEDKRAAVLDRVRDVLRTDPETRDRSTFVLPYRTRVYWCERL
jgi:ubiquinone/menaquinone biosynthesis C-methylase UbiE